MVDMRMREENAGQRFSAAPDRAGECLHIGPEKQRVDQHDVCLRFEPVGVCSPAIFGRRIHMKPRPLRRRVDVFSAHR